MSELDGGKKLEGLARSIDALFGGAGSGTEGSQARQGSRTASSGADGGVATEGVGTAPVMDGKGADGEAEGIETASATDGPRADGEAAPGAGRAVTADGGPAAADGEAASADGEAAADGKAAASDGRVAATDGAEAAPPEPASPPREGMTGRRESNGREAGRAPTGGPEAARPASDPVRHELPPLDPFLPLGEPPDEEADRTAVPEPIFGTPEGLAVVVEEYLGATASRRAGRAEHLRRTAESLSRVNEGSAALPPDALEALTDAAERLSAALGDAPAEWELDLVRALLVQPVARGLVARLCAEREEARRNALLTLCRRFAPQMSEALSRALIETDERFARRACLDAVVAMGDASLPVVETMLADERWFVVRNAVTILGDVAGDRAVELVTGALAHGDPRVRREALMSLAKLGGESAGLLAHGMLEDTDATVRLAAAMAAGSLKVERALKPLLKMLETESDPDVIPGVLRALGRLGDPGAVHAIEKFAVGRRFSKPKEQVRIAAYQALHHIGTPHARKLLIKAKGDKSAAVREAVREMG